jgi:4-aminobutyrate aminotransferase-like enzyme
LPAACAVAVATIDAFADPAILGHVADLEAAARRTYGTFPDRFEQVGDVRIIGALTAIEFVTDRATKERDLDLQERVAREALRRGLMADSSSASYNVQPSLVCPTDVFEQGAEIVAAAIETSL